MVPAKTCSFNCAFCEVGQTTALTLERQEYVPLADIIREFEHWLTEDGGVADVITLAGSGEPTLHSRFGELIDAIKSACSLPVVVLTNSSMMHRADVRTEAAKADIVKVSLSAWDEASFHKINRPPPGITLEQIVGGLQQFREIFGGKLWLEVFLLRKLNDRPADVAKIADLAETIRPDQVQLNTVVRPPADTSAMPVARNELELLAPLFKPPAEIIASFRAEADQAQPGALEAGYVLAMITRRPCTLEDIAGAFKTTVESARQTVDALLADGRANAIERPDGIYYGASEV